MEKLNFEALNNTKFAVPIRNNTNLKDDSNPAVENSSVERQLPSKTIRSCSCCWPQISPFFRQLILTIVTGMGGLAIGTIYAYPAVALARWEDADLKLSTTQITWFGELCT
ncbi:hypothetical protein E2C01_074149 [Portunus trituberculatus]|uniref:Uncharacterized protein n=1 Tax=Portunus trituberculatus TaxID=210409 RepID=A0A5B7IBF2_PORTR|nr:hypothetical protein [Portunus trituberculatus]